MFTQIKNFLVLLMVITIAFPSACKTKYPPLRIGNSIGIKDMNYERLKAMKDAGIDCIEITTGGFISTKKPKTDAEITELLTRTKLAADSAGIEIWSIHMPFGKDIDISQTDEKIRKNSVALHMKVLEFCKIIQPKIILFHPSWYLGHNERNERIAQLVRSVNELNPKVKELGAKMVIENMLGYELVRNEQHERPLGRTVEEVKLIMKQLPKNVYSAIDMNHIDNPELLIQAMGKRLKSVHIADGDGRHECHYLPNPCSGKGDNDWIKILKELYKARYTGPFMYEVKTSEYKEFKDLYNCYQNLYQNFIDSNK